MSKVEAVPTAKGVSSSTRSGLLLQRQCACGGTCSLTGTCSECDKRKMLGHSLQAKLRINEPDDEFEQEADRVAVQVMDMPVEQIEGGVRQSQSWSPVQRRADRSSTAFGEPAPRLLANILAASGQPLDRETRAFFEPRFGHDFGFVRIHADQEAAASAHAVHAMAYTLGSHIVFAAGHYSPTTKQGRRLVAHELSHVLQQRASIASGIVQRSSPEQPSTAGPSQTVSQDIDAAVTIGGEPFHLVAISGPLSSESAAWRYRTGVNDYLSSYPNLGNGWWALVVRPGDGAPCNIGGNCLGWALGNFGLVDPADQVWGLVPTFLDSIGRSVRGHRSAQDTYLRQVGKEKIAASAIWNYFMATQFHAVPVESEEAANLALYGRGFSGPMDGPSHIAFRTAGGERWVSKPSAATPPILHGTAVQMIGGQTGEVMKLYACPSGPPNQVLLSQGQSQGSPSP